MQVMASVLHGLSRLLWAVLGFFILYYLYHFIRDPETFKFWGFYATVAHSLLVSAWALVAFGIGFAAKRLRAKALKHAD